MEGGHHSSEDRERGHYNPEMHLGINQLKNVNEHLGTFGIIWQALQIFWNNVKILLVVQLAVGLPVYILIQGMAFLSEVYVNQVTKPNVTQMGTSLTAVNGFLSAWFTPSVFSHLSYHHTLKLSVDTDVGSLLEFIAIVVLAFCVEIVFSIAIMALQALSISANIYAVGLLCIGRSLSFDSVVKGAIPRLWKRLVLSLAYYVLIFQSGIYVLGLLVYFLLTTSLLSASVWLRYVPLVVLAVLFILFCYYWAILNFVLIAVSVLQDNYGWDGLKVTWNLLGGRKWVAFFIIFLYSLVMGIPQSITNSSTTFLDLDNPWTLTNFLAFVIQILLITVVYQFQFLTSAVAYISFKAYHKEPISSRFISNFDSEGEHEYLLVE